ncbi:Uncharacterized protein dnl_53310 [Desulfonema limicola]|uniref:Uncharacterized protein n=1 Tax=Desulfonema limicola TaxID=45656 RepID=A0A975BD19_9BACT|nr:hypothetical protein [Desulfonema limicola]QTA82944.1 Uncharacterized protein dnl_53310 [Desulfonema limicola]
MQISNPIITPFQILKAIENLTDAEKETLAIMADEKLSEELMKRRKETLLEMKRGELLSEDELFEDI